MPDLVNIAFMGAGDIATMHAEAIGKCPGTKLVGLWSIDDALNRQKAADFGDCKVYKSADALVADSDIDAVFVLTNFETHTEYALKAIAAGKHTFIEKPVAVNHAELNQLKEAAAEKGVVLMPGHNYIYEPGINRTHNLLRDGKLGDLISIYVLYHIHHPEHVAVRYPGVIRQILTHHAYLLLYLAGAPESVSALKASLHYENCTEEDIAMVNMKMKSGALAHFTASYAADDNSSDPWTFVVKVIGSEGSTRFSYRDWVENKPGPAHAHTWTAYQEGLDNEVAHFVECVRGNAEPLSTIDDAGTALDIITACETSVAEERTVKL